MIHIYVGHVTTNECICYNIVVPLTARSDLAQLLAILDTWPPWGMLATSGVATGHFWQLSDYMPPKEGEEEEKKVKKVRTYKSR